MENTKESMSTLMQEVFARAGFRPLTTENGEGTFDVGGLTFAWQCEMNPEEGDVRAVTVWCSVGTLSEEPKKEIVERLLAMNLFGAEVRGGHLGFYSPTRALIYSCRLKPSVEDPEDTLSTLKAFTEAAASFIEEINALGGRPREDVPLFGSSMLFV